MKNIVFINKDKDKNEQLKIVQTNLTKFWFLMNKLILQKNVQKTIAFY